jgi:peptidoglycan hydrolase-like protein with peptidoglycan-binding domain
VALVALLLGALGLVLHGCGGEEEWSGEQGDRAMQTGQGKADGARSWPVLRLGHWNKDVVTAQYLLRHHGESGFELNGKFGQATDRAVRRFQRRNGLQEDGVIGGKSWSRLIQGARRGDSGMKVGAIQYLLLKRYGYGISVTKIFGATTEARVRAFQEARCINPDGAVGYETWYALIVNSSRCGGPDVEHEQEGADTTRANALASAARQGQAGWAHGRCWAYVWKAMLKTGVATNAGGDKLGAAGPCSLGQFNTSAYCFGRNAAANPGLLYQTFRMKRLWVSPRSAPRGAVIVWDRGCNGYSYAHGHIEVAQGDGTACSDFCGSIAHGGSHCSWVFVPAL